jgi:hypothetical protein
MILWKLPMPLPFVTQKHNQRSVKSCHKNCFSPFKDGRYFEAPRLCKLYHFIFGMIMKNVSANFWFGHICLESNSTGALYSKFWMEKTCQFGSAKWFWACIYAQVAEARKGCSKARKLLLIG